MFLCILSFELDMKELKSIRHTSRTLKLKPKELEIQMLDDYIQISFQLSSGQYATTLLRQLMQSPPSAYF